MRITENSPLNKTSAASKKKSISSASDGDFMGLLAANETESTTGAQAPSEAPKASMDALIALQEIPDNEIIKRQAVQEGKGALETLERLRLDLLSGNISGNILTRLGDVAKLKQQYANDSNLDAVIQDIELRAAVELAKLQRASENLK